MSGLCPFFTIRPPGPPGRAFASKYVWDSHAIFPQKELSDAPHQEGKKLEDAAVEKAAS